MNLRATVRNTGIIALLFVMQFFLFHMVYAMEIPEGSFIVRPAKVELSFNPGEEKTTVMQLSNTTPSPLLIDVSYEDIASIVQKVASDDPIVLLGNKGGVYPLQSFFVTPTSSIPIASGETKNIPITIRIPKDVEAGGRYGSVVFSFHPEHTGENDPHASITMASRLATTFYVRVNGNVNESGKLAAFGLFNNKFIVQIPTPERPVQFQVAYENSGTVHLNPYGEIVVSSFLGGKTTLSIDPWVVLPHATRMREIDLFDSIRPGYYQAHIRLNRGYADIIDEQDVSFIILPGRKSLIGIAILFVLFFFLIKRSLSLSKHIV